MTTTNFTKFFVGAGILALTATSCSNEIDVTPDNVGGNGRSAFMTVNLHDVNRGTRAGEEFNDGKYDDGDESEYKIDNARFFFFDENGAYICESSVWNGHNMVGSTTDNITLEGKTVVVLENLTQKTNPTYMITVLNADGFTPAATLEATAESLWQYSITKEVDGKEEKRFVMSSTSYLGDKPNHVDRDEDANMYTYFANKLTEDNFAEGTPSTTAEGLKPVDVYIERLAGKVELKLDNLSNFKKTYTDEDGHDHTIYKINATVAGNLNAEGGIEEGVTELWIEILGWGLNGTNPASYLSKQFDTAWIPETANPWQDWNNPNDRRSFWAKSLGYGEKDYELNFITWPSIKNNKYNYANEYAALPSIYNADELLVDPSKLTHVLLKTNICDGNGKPLDLVRGANGVLYHKESYLKYILNNANIQLQKGLNMWYLTDKTDLVEVDRETLENGEVKITYASTAKFAQIDERMVTIDKSDLGTGLVKVVAGDLKTLKDDNGEAYVWAKKNDDGTFTTLTNDEGVAHLNGILSTVNGNKADSRAMAYTGGANYYTIPIEHNKYVDKTVKEGGAKYNLGYYGFIRNHWYQISISKIEKVGYGLFNPGKDENDETAEKIIPVGPENPAFYVTANLKVLAWKIVQQGVDL